MDRGASRQAYIKLANSFYDKKISESDLPLAAAGLPPLDKALLDELAEFSEGFALNEPRRSWSITEVADQAANSQKCDLFIRSLAAWYLGRASNHWGQPKRVAASISRAHRGFRQLKQAGWLAACDWQSNVLSWTKADFGKAARELEQAVKDLQQEGFTKYVPHCQRVLGYAQILVGEFDNAKINLAASAAAFAAEGNILDQAHCWLHEASLLRRQARFDDAVHLVNRAMKVFEDAAAVVDMAHVHSQLAMISLMRLDGLAEAISHFEHAQQIYAKVDLELWWADSTTNLGSIYLQHGRFEEADELLRRARPIFVRYGVQGLLADNLNDSGILHTLRGRPDISVRQFKQAEALHKKLGTEYSSATDEANLGEAYGRLGRYQDALYHVESAVERLRIFGNPHRLGFCEKNIAVIWSELGQPALAHAHLDNAAACFEKTEQKGLLSLVYISQATVYLQEGQPANAVECLEKVLSISKELGIRSQTALAQRLLGEALLRNGRRTEALDQLMQAKSDFSEIGMTYEQAAALVALGECYAQQHELRSAREAFEEALSLSQNIFPELEWKAYAGLGSLAGIEKTAQAEIQAYRSGAKALAQIRQNLWQPSLIGSYSQSPTEFFDRAISLAAEVNSVTDTLDFIEQNKATSLLLQLSMSTSLSETKQVKEIKEIRAQIEWLQQQFRVSFDASSPLKSTIETRPLKTELSKKVDIYNAKMDQLERQTHSAGRAMVTISNFDIDRFRHTAGNELGSFWLALDYYLMEDKLIIVVISPESCKVKAMPLSKKFQMALEITTRATFDTGIPSPTIGDLRVLGDCLIPADVVEMLRPDTHLLLIPHKGLHGIPWAALQPGDSAKPLVCLCTPSVISSLHSLVFIWTRTADRRVFPGHEGLLVGLSEFHGVRRELPFVKDELRVLHKKMSEDGSVLAEEEATWQNLINLCHKPGQNHNRAGLSRFDWLHIASHVFTDTQSGRLSGIALADGDVWLDKFMDLAPLPPLVTLSACNSVYTYIYKGDEHVGLPTTCLAAGANCVVGSLWPVIDKAAADFSISFYDKYFKGLSPAQAVAHIQRQMIDNNEPINTWASFVCIGAP